MERCFVTTKDSELVKDFNRYQQTHNAQRNFVFHFMMEKGIESDKYHLGGVGIVDAPFKESNKSDIVLRISPTENDIKNFGNMLNKPDKYGLYSFRKSSSIAKEFAQKCVDNEIVINLMRPRARNYFKSIGYSACSYEFFELKDVYYFRVNSDSLKEEDTPEGFKEIKQSEFYKAREELQEQHKEG